MNLIKSVFRPIYAPFVRQYRNRQQLFAHQETIKQQIETVYEKGNTLKIIIGAGETTYEGWVATDIPAFDILKHEHWAVLFQPSTIHRMVAEHVFEHLTTDQLRDFLRIARIYLADTGRIRIAVPDGYHPDSTYIEHVRPDGIGIGADDHKVLYTSDLMKDVMTAQGYDYQLLEYFDRAGNFQQVKWDTADGFIKRSAHHDKRNANGKLAYTSLIIDCWVADKP